MKKTKDDFSQQQNDRLLHFKDLVRSYVELENRSESLEEKIRQ